MLSRICRRHFTKIVIAVAVVYLLSAVHFFGTDVSEKKDHHPDRSVTLDSERQYEDGELSTLPPEKEVEKESAKVEIFKPKTHRHLDTQPIYQAIDPTEDHRRKRLQVLKEIYALPYPGDETYKLNESLSRTIDLDRLPADLRPAECKKLEYNIDTLPTVSIIFPIYNEALSMLLRAVHSIINNTPQRLLLDVILVDDDSKNENLKEPLDRYIALLPAKVRILRNEQREGLIRSRMRGAAIARGEVLMFQDAHTEFSKGWAEATLSYIQKHPNAIVQPVVEELQVNSISWPTL